MADSGSASNITEAIMMTEATPLIFDAMPVDQFIVVVCLSAIFLLGLPLNILSLTSIIARSVHRQVDVIDTYVLNACLAYMWMLLFSLLPYLVSFLTEQAVLFGRVGCHFLPFLRQYPLYVLATLVTGMAVHACRAAPEQVRRRRPAEWTPRLVWCAAWLSGLIAALEIFVHKLVGDDACIEDRNDTIIFYVSRVVSVVLTWFLPLLAVFIVFPLAFCHVVKGATMKLKKNKQRKEDGFPIYRLDSYPEPTFTAGHITLAFFIGLIHWCCLTPLIAAKVINTVDETFMDKSFAEWMPYFECVHYVPAFLVPLLYTLTLTARKK